MEVDSQVTSTLAFMHTMHTYFSWMGKLSTYTPFYICMIIWTRNMDGSAFYTCMHSIKLLISLEISYLIPSSHSKLAYIYKMKVVWVLVDLMKFRHLNFWCLIIFHFIILNYIYILRLNSIKISSKTSYIYIVH